MKLMPLVLALAALGLATTAPSSCSSSPIASTQEVLQIGSAFEQLATTSLNRLDSYLASDPLIDEGLRQSMQLHVQAARSSLASATTVQHALGLQEQMVPLLSALAVYIQQDPALDLLDQETQIQSAQLVVDMLAEVTDTTGVDIS